MRISDWSSDVCSSDLKATRYESKLLNSQAILKYGIRIALIQLKKPNKKKSDPIIRIEIRVSLLLNESASTPAFVFIFYSIKFCISLCHRVKPLVPNQPHIPGTKGSSPHRRY